MTHYGITGFGAYVPRLRMDRGAIAAAHKWMAPSLKGMAKGERAFASWDEDAITMAVEAGRDVLGDRSRDGIGRLTDLTHSVDTTTIADYQWEYDQHSRVVDSIFSSWAGGSGSAEYSYDNTNQLTAADHSSQTMRARP